MDDHSDAKRALMEAFATLFDLLDHISAMRKSMERLEMYILVMVIMLAAMMLAGTVAGLSYFCSHHHQRTSRRENFSPATPAKALSRQPSSSNSHHPTTSNMMPRHTSYRHTYVHSDAKL